MYMATSIEPLAIEMQLLLNRLLNLHSFSIVISIIIGMQKIWKADNLNMYGYGYNWKILSLCLNKREFFKKE